MSVLANQPPKRRNLMAIGTVWERHVADTLRALGWRVSTYGQELLSDEARAILRGTSDPQRFAPDLLGQSPTGARVYIEAKHSDPTKTGRHAVQDDASDAHFALIQSLGAPLIYAFPDGVGRICWMHVLRFKAHAERRPFLGNGSGTPFSTASHRLCTYEPMTAAAWGAPTDEQASLW